MGKLAIVVTGLPGSGKTTLGKSMAERLGLPMLDKDDYLEALFDKKGTGDLAWRQTLSRESDHLFIEDAKQNEAVVLVSHWRPEQSGGTSGTPVEWLDDCFSRVVEVYCNCTVDTAVERFVNRVRHPGHQDQLKSSEEIRVKLAEYYSCLPLSLGDLEIVDADANQQLEPLISRLSRYVTGDT